MFGLGALRLVVLVFVCANADSDSERNLNNTTGYVSDVADGAVKNENSSERQYLVEYSDYMDVPNFRKKQSGHFDYFNFDLNVKNDNVRVVVNKCCSWNYFFDVDSLRCVRFLDTSNSSEFVVKTIQNVGNESSFLFVASFPKCRNNTVLSVRVVSTVGVESSWVTLDGHPVSRDYCIDEDPKHPNGTVVASCVDSDTYCKTHPCFRKCCPVGESYELSTRKCQKTKTPFSTDFYNLTTLVRDASIKLSHFGIQMGDACGVKGKFLLEKEEGEMSYLGSDGSLFAPIFEKRYSKDDFCIEHVKTGNDTSVESFLCFSISYIHFENSPLQFFLLSLGFIISCMFLMLTFMVYLFSPKSQNTHGKTLMCYIACLFTAYLCLAIVELKSKELNKNVCTYMAYSVLFSFLAAFFWLNVMSFDIWRTFRLDRSVDRTKSDKENLKFFKYSIYAWTFPSIATAVCAVANQMPDFPFDSIRPGIGEDHCWFSKKTNGIYVFFIAPISIIITCNIIFYVQTAWKIWKVKSDVRKMEKQKKKRFSANKDQFMINGKLFVVMGITWSLEIISFFAPHPIWYLTDAANALHGVFIFAVFVLKKKVLRQMSQQLRIPLKTTRQQINEDITRKNFQDLKTCGTTGMTPVSLDESKTSF